MSGSIALRKLEDGDLPLFKKWLYLHHVAAWYHAPLDWLEEVEKRDGAFSFLHHFMVERDGKAIVRALVEKIKALPDAKRIIVQPEPENRAPCGVLLASGFHYDTRNEIYVLPLAASLA